MFFHEQRFTNSNGREVKSPDLAERLNDHYHLQSGFVICMVGAVGSTVSVKTLWRSAAHFDEFSRSVDAQRVAEVLGDQGLAPKDERREEDVTTIEPSVEELRLIQATVVRDDLDRIVDYWHAEGRELNETAPGCVRAQVSMDREESQLHFAIWWRTKEEAEHFRYTDHLDGELARNFGPGFRSFGRYSLLPVSDFF